MLRQSCSGLCLYSCIFQAFTEFGGAPTGSVESQSNLGWKFTLDLISSTPCSEKGLVWVLGQVFSGLCPAVFGVPTGVRTLEPLGNLFQHLTTFIMIFPHHQCQGFGSKAAGMASVRRDPGLLSASHLQFQLSPVGQLTDSILKGSLCYLCENGFKWRMVNSKQKEKQGQSRRSNVGKKSAVGGKEREDHTWAEPRGCLNRS